MSPEELRVCDSCIQVIDEKLADGINKRFHSSGNTNNRGEEEYEQEANFNNGSVPGNSASGSSSSASGCSSSSISSDAPATREPPKKTGGRAVLTMGQYRAEIKESEGNRYIRDRDL